jgi:hypothetical protein
MMTTASMDAVIDQTCLQIAARLYQLTLVAGEGDFADERLPTAMELSKDMGFKLEMVKKRLRNLVHLDLAQIATYTPKRYRFNLYTLRHLSPDDELYDALYGEDSIFVQKLSDWEWQFS